MKNYLKILLITLAIQLIGVFGESLLYNLESSPGTLRWVRNIIFLGCVLVAIIVDIILAIRWGRNIKEKLIYISYAYKLSLDSNFARVILACCSVVRYIGEYIQIIKV